MNDISPLVPSPGRWPGLFIFALLLTPLVAHAAAPLQFQSPDGRRIVGAVEARAPIVVDGALDEEVWRLAEPAADFLQAEPHEGDAASEPTEVRLAFDRDALYIGVVCHDREPSALIVNDIRKDFVAGEQDSFEVILDTFADRRNGFVFVVNPLGAKSDAQIANEGRDVNTSWDAVWSVATKRDGGGWSAEIRIPFKTLRFERGGDRIWGVNFSRRIRRKNEIDYWSPVPRVYNLYRAGLGGTLTGLPDASQGHNLRLKPWIAADSTRPLGGSSFSPDGHVGIDAKYGVTPSLTLDVTAKPDFAQAEADEQQVNLTQFSLFYTDQSNQKVSHTNHVAMAWFFETGGYLELQWNPRFERIITPFQIRRDQSFAPGAYGWNEYVFELETNHSRKVSGSALLTMGGFWTGTQKTTKVGVLFRPSYHLTFDTAIQRSDIDLPFPMHAFVTNLVTSRVGYAFNTRTFLDTLLQYNTDLKQFSANVRLDLIHRPLSDLFVVYNEQQLTDQPTPVNTGRGLIVKYTHMLAF